MSDFLNTVCPYCGERHDAVGPLQQSDIGEAPIAGDVSLCFKCGRPAIFDFNCDGALRKPDKIERREIRNDKWIQRAMTAWRQVKGESR